VLSSQNYKKIVNNSRYQLKAVRFAPTPRCLFLRVVRRALVLYLLGERLRSQRRVPESFRAAARRILRLGCTSGLHAQHVYEGCVQLVKEVGLL